MEGVTGLQREVGPAEGKAVQDEGTSQESRAKGAAQGPAWGSSCKNHISAYEMGEMMKLEVIASAEGVWLARLEMDPNTKHGLATTSALLVLG